jgi:prepilin-type N-terminal cleavage/methylation domain-containing protein
MAIANLKSQIFAGQSSRHRVPACGWRAVRRMPQGSSGHVVSQRRLAPLADGTRSVPATLRRGMTLIELLVVVGILLAVAVMMVPRLPAIMERAKVREAARAIQLYLSTARNLAMSTGRSCGVMIEPLLAENGCAMTLTQMETPPPYGGDSLGSTATAVAQSDMTAKITLSPPSGVDIHPGDMIQIGYQGYWMPILANPDASVPTGIYPPGTTTLKAGIDFSHGETPAWFYQPVTGPYKLIRWPTKSTAAALQLPSPAVIDLTASGNDPVGNSLPVWPLQPWPPSPPPSPGTTPLPVTIMFAADGTIDWVSHWDSNPKNRWGQQVTTPMYLLVGRRNKVKPPNPNDANLNDFNSLWISINPATGLILVSDLAALPQDPKNVTAADFAQSRAFARQASANGGK